MLTIRLSRIGKSKKAAFRVILQEHTQSPKGKALEQLGSYDPATKKLTIKKERVEYWVSKGSQISSTVANILKKNGVSNMEKFIKQGTHKKKKKKEPAPAPVAAAAPAPAAPEAAPATPEAPAA